MNARTQDNTVSPDALVVDDSGNNGEVQATLHEALLGAGTCARSELLG